MTQRWRLIRESADRDKELYDVQADPGQTRNVADERPQVVEELTAAYEKWWASVSERFDECCPIVLGSDQANPARLMSHDWHGCWPAWSQGSVRQAHEASGFWAVDIERDGIYEFALRRWPKELDLPIAAGLPDGTGKAIAATKARIRIADRDETKSIPGGAKEAKFTFPLKAGETRLQTWLIDDARSDAKPRGAYYVYVRRLP